MHHLQSLMGIILLTACVSPAAAGPLAVKKPSEFKLVTSSLAPSPSCGVNLALDTQVNKDGTSAPLVVPVGQVLVLTGWSFFGIYGSSVPKAVYLSVGVQVVAAHLLTPDPANYYAAFDSSLPNVAVAPGTAICLGHGGVTPGGIGAVTVSGFLAKDK